MITIAGGILLALAALIIIPLVLYAIAIILVAPLDMVSDVVHAKVSWKRIGKSTSIGFGLLLVMLALFGR